MHKFPGPLVSTDFGSLLSLQQFFLPSVNRVDDKVIVLNRPIKDLSNDLIGVRLVVLCTEVGQTSGDDYVIESVGVRTLPIMYCPMNVPHFQLRW